MIVIENLDHISLGSSNLKRSIEFYTEIFGFELIEQTEKSAVLEWEILKLRLNYIPNYKFPINNPIAMNLSFSMDIDDFTNAVIEFEQKKIPIEIGPIPIDKGESLVIRDPDGNWIELFYREE